MTGIKQRGLARISHQFRRSLLGLSTVFFMLNSFGADCSFAANGLSGHSDGTVQSMDEIVVVADKVDDFVRNNPSQVVSMGAVEIEQRNFLRVREVLGAMPGVDIKDSAGGMGSRISIRGGGGSGAVLVLIDGRRAATMQYGGVDLSSIPIDLVKQITVFKPPVPVWLGPDSAAGAIYIETRKKNTQTKKDAKGKVRLTGGSYGLASMTATGQVDTEYSRYLASGGVSHKDGKRANSQKDQGNLNLGYNWKDEGRELQLHAKTYISDHGIAGPTYKPTPDATQRYTKSSLDFRYKSFCELADYTLKGWTDLTNLDETSQDGSESSLDTLTAGLGSDFYFVPDDSDDELRIGVDFEQNSVDHTLSGEHNRSRFGGNTEYTYRNASWTYILGARADYTNDFDLSPGGHTGLNYAASEATTFRANVGYSEHIPTFGQLYQPSHGSVDHVRGNPDLKKEKNITTSLGVEHEFPAQHSIALSVFRVDSHELIKYQRDSEDISSPENIDQAFKQGLEATFSYAFSDSTDVEFNYILQESENHDSGNELSYTPTHKAKVIFKTEFYGRTRFEWITRAYSKQYTDTDNTEEECIDAYVATDLKLSHPVTFFKNKGLVFANVHNLFDQDYSSHYGYPDDGVKVEVGVSVNW